MMIPAAAGIVVYARLSCFLDHRVARQRFCAGLGMIDNRPRIVTADDDAERFLLDAPHQPGSMDVFVRHGGQFRYVAPDELAFWVEFSRLGDRVEDAEIRLRPAWY